MNVPLAQRLWLARLDAIQPGRRVILSQTAREHTWRPWQEQPPDGLLWTRGVLVNEVLFGPDALLFPEASPSLWKPPVELERAIRRSIDAAIRRAQKRAMDRAGEPAALANGPPMDADPCIARALAHGAPPGERKKTLLHVL